MTQNDAGEGGNCTRNSQNSTRQTARSNHGMYQEELNESLRREGMALKISFKDLDELNDLIQRVQNWKFEVKNFLDKQTIR